MSETTPIGASDAVHAPQRQESALLLGCTVPAELARRWHYDVRQGYGEDCWEWLGRVGGGGYGVIHYGNRRYYAARVAWELVRTERFPPGLMACHTCDHRWCVNPDHIYAGTAGDNMRDAIARDRIGLTGRRTHG